MNSLVESIDVTPFTPGGTDRVGDQRQSMSGSRLGTVLLYQSPCGIQQLLTIKAL